MAPVIGAVIAAIVVFKREPLILDGRLIDKSRRDVFDQIAEIPCANKDRHDLQHEFRETAKDCITAAYLAYNPETKTKPERLRKRFGANVLVIENSAIVDLWFGKRLEGPEREPFNVPIDRVLKLRRPAEPAPDGNRIKLAKPVEQFAPATKPSPMGQANKMPDPKPIAAAPPKPSERPRPTPTRAVNPKR